ncbi:MULTISPECIES: pyridoxal phosphate-dependent decarboxylase family protein [Tenacibaculum]|uniref:Aspartate aminotransferase family protein n=1 Tax=Tenacibaculum discolor TaxID=361581 RepID=A0A2G1BXA9_9FLAO|nr:MULTISPECIES: aspartate aminotransferase family protein [Tenacibaculum]PHN99468.1 decarboxylase [Rhodobacteraceae bacterium 4F10]MDP2540715.1 aspartate aminotransferase family protein [Tenacibaculum discolor]NVK08677.1 aspartate aminotransferase family protein [Tenacibaculum sp.]PHN98670.1 decarboxylase [Tenacibaculum discolor]RLK02249.1 glutamate/tyrosine decarboxylase-like PLP-dependent enzyme [Tenacibaculum discolor]
MSAHFDLSKEEMKSYGYKIVDIIAEHWATLEQKKPVASASRKEMDSIFLQEAPNEGMSAEKVLDFVMDNVIPNSTVISHPKAYSFVPGPSNFISTMADSLATGFNIFSGGWMVSPAAAELEIVTMNWLLKMYNFPVEKGGGIFTSGGSMANLTALVTARRLKCGDDFSKAVIYLSDQAHSSNIKAIRVLGFKKEQIRILPTDLEFRISINKLKNAIAKDRLEGLQPFCYIASAGTTNTGTVDPLDEIADICEEEDLWFHIDGAYGGAAILAEKGAKALRGIERADSLTVDPHKWFYQPYEIGCLLVKDASWLSGTFSEKPEYLRDIEGNESEINFYDYGIQLTRRFRALKFYMSIKTYGLDAFKEAVTYNIQLADDVEKMLRKSRNWEIISPATLAVINFRYNPIGLNLEEKEIDELNQKISQKIMESREAFLVTTILNKQVVLRMCLINPKTTMDDIKETLELCHQFGEEILKEK